MALKHDPEDVAACTVADYLLVLQSVYLFSAERRVKST
jgi:hypothetical protein